MPQYTYLLTSQLESQRHYFEGKVAQIETAAQEQVLYISMLVTDVNDISQLNTLSVQKVFTLLYLVAKGTVMIIFSVVHEAEA